MNIETCVKKIRRRLESEGWKIKSANSHQKWQHPDKPVMIMIPNHQTLSIGLAKKVARRAGWEN